MLTTPMTPTTGAALRRVTAWAGALAAAAVLAACGTGSTPNDTTGGNSTSTDSARDDGAAPADADTADGLPTIGPLGPTCEDFLASSPKEQDAAAADLYDEVRKRSAEATENSAADRTDHRDARGLTDVTASDEPKIVSLTSAACTAAADRSVSIGEATGLSQLHVTER